MTAIATSQFTPFSADLSTALLQAIPCLFRFRTCGVRCDDHNSVVFCRMQTDAGVLPLGN